MSTAKELRKEVTEILASSWERREGRMVPDSESIELGNDAVELDATVLYADVADSTELVDNYKAAFAAKIYKTYLVTSCRIIRDRGGVVTAFDGDRVMAVFRGDDKNSAAARAALEIRWVVREVINPAVKTRYPKTAFELQHGVGIDTSPLFVARAGIRGSNDLVWVGRAANYAAKLSAFRSGNYSSFITEDVFRKLNKKSKYGGSPPRLMWNKIMWEEMGITIYGSSWWWKV